MCRKAFGKNYKDMWIDPLYFDDKYFRYTEDFFSEVGVYLYPKITDLRKELARRSYSVPPKHDKVAWNEYRHIVWGIIHKDIQENINKGIEPIEVKVKGVRIPDDYDDYIEKITKVERVKHLKTETEQYTGKANILTWD
jgi:hypothetical protein